MVDESLRSCVKYNEESSQGAARQKIFKARFRVTKYGLQIT